MNGSEWILSLELFAVGVFIWLAKYLASEEDLTWRQIVGKSVLNGSASLMAGTLVLFVSNPPTIALIGLSAFLGSLGSEAAVSYIKSFKA